MTKQALARSVWRLGLIALLGLSGVPTVTGAKDFTGLRGRVVDTTGAAMVGVTVTATNESTGLTYSTATNETGGYELRGLLPGTYTLTVEVAGFKDYEKAGVIVYPQSLRRVDITMEIGDIADAITVSGRVADFNTEDFNTEEYAVIDESGFSSVADQAAVHFLYRCRHRLLRQPAPVPA